MEPIKKGDTIFSASVTAGKVKIKRHTAFYFMDGYFKVCQDREGTGLIYPTHIMRDVFDAGRYVDKYDRYFARTPDEALAYLTDALAAKRVALVQRVAEITEDELAVRKAAKEVAKQTA